MSPMEIIGACAVALILLAYACFLTGFIVDDRAKKREEAIGATHAAAIADINRQLAHLRGVVNANADADGELEAFVRLAATRFLETRPVDGEVDEDDEDEPVGTPYGPPAIWERFATPLVLPPAPDVRAQLVPPPDWAGATSIFNDLAASTSLHTVARAAAPEDTRATTYTGDMAAYVRRVTDPVDVDEHDDGCTCVECQYAAIARAELAGATA